MKKHTRFICHFDTEEEMLISFAMKCTGLDRTTTIRLMLRRGVIEEIIRYRECGVPKLPDFLKELVDLF